MLLTCCHFSQGKNQQVKGSNTGQRVYPPLPWAFRHRVCISDVRSRHVVEVNSVETLYLLRKNLNQELHVFCTFLYKRITTHYIVTLAFWKSMQVKWWLSSECHIVQALWLWQITIVIPHKWSLTGVYMSHQVVIGQLVCVWKQMRAN